MKRLKNNRGEGQISVGVKIILAVVIGALILGGLYGTSARGKQRISGRSCWQGSANDSRIDYRCAYGG